MFQRSWSNLRYESLVVNVIAASLDATVILGLNQGLHVLGMEVMFDRRLVFVSASMLIVSKHISAQTLTWTHIS